MSMVLQSGVMYYRENDQDTWHPLIIKAQSVDISVLVDSYDPNETKSWMEGEYCLYNDQIWRCITPFSTPAPFDSTKWTETYLSDEIERLGIAVQDSEPATSKVWIDTDETSSVTCPDISEFNNLADSLGIVVNGSVARAACTKTGQYVILQNSSVADHADGLYTASKIFSAGTTIDGTYLKENAPKNVGGAVNDLKNSFDNFISQYLEVVDLGELGNLNIQSRNAGAIYYFNFVNNATNSPFGNSGGHGFLFVNTNSANYGVQIAMGNAGVACRALFGGNYGTWSNIILL